jgi:hypothetical protein
MSKRNKGKTSAMLLLVFSAAMSSTAFAQFTFTPPGPAKPVFQSFCYSAAAKLQCVSRCMNDYIVCKTRFAGEPPADVQACQAAYTACRQGCESRLWVVPCEEGERSGQPLAPQPEPLPW